MQHKHIHITLIGGQSLPIYQLILETVPSEIIFLHSKDSKKAAELIGSIYKQRNDDVNTVFVEVDPTNYVKIKEECNKLFNQYKDTSVNLTGGTKVMVLGLYDAAKEANCEKIFYIDQNGAIQNFANNELTITNAALNIAEIFALNNNLISSSINFEYFLKEDQECYKKINALLSFNAGEYYKLIKTIANKDHLITYTTDKGSVYLYDKSKKEISIKLKRPNKNDIEVTFNGNNVLYLIKNTGWYELFVAKTIRHWQQHLELLVSVKVPYTGGSDKNEIDIILNVGSKLFFFECKTQVYDIKDIDKFKNVIKNYGGASSKGFLVTNEKIIDRHAEKCRDNNIIPIHYNINKHKPEDLIKILKAEINSNNIR